MAGPSPLLPDPALIPHDSSTLKFPLPPTSEMSGAPCHQLTNSLIPSLQAYVFQVGSFKQKKKRLSQGNVRTVCGGRKSEAGRRVGETFWRLFPLLFFKRTCRMHPGAVTINLCYLTSKQNSGWKSSPKITLHSFASCQRHNKTNPSLVFINKGGFSLCSVFFFLMKCTSDQPQVQRLQTQQKQKQYVKIDFC